MKSMSLETATVVSVDPDSLVVETIQRSTCDSCRAASGCGHAVLSTMASTSTQIRVLMGNFNPNRLKVGQRVTIGIPENLLVAGALSAYLVPLVFALAGAMLGSYADNFMERDVVSVIGGFIGLIAGGWLVRLGQKRVGIDKFKTPVLVNLLDT